MEVVVTVNRSYGFVHVGDGEGGVDVVARLTSGPFVPLDTLRGEVVRVARERCGLAVRLGRLVEDVRLERVVWLGWADREPAGVEVAA